MQPHDLARSVWRSACCCLCRLYTKRKAFINLGHNQHVIWGSCNMTKQPFTLLFTTTILLPKQPQTTQPSDPAHPSAIKPELLGVVSATKMHASSIHGNFFIDIPLFFMSLELFVLRIFHVYIIYWDFIRFLSLLIQWLNLCPLFKTDNFAQLRDVIHASERQQVLRSPQNQGSLHGDVERGQESPLPSSKLT